MPYYNRNGIFVPDAVSGRTVSKRGVHLHPAAYHSMWMTRASYWIQLLVDMDMSWVVIMTDGDSALHPYENDMGEPMSAVEILLRNGIIPLIRDSKPLLPAPFNNMATVELSVAAYAPYGLKPFWILRNEPGDAREWKNSIVPPDWFYVFIDWWNHAADIVIGLGAYAGFPDGPCYDQNIFKYINRSKFKSGAFFTAHNYGKARHRDFPYDAALQHGTPMTQNNYDFFTEDLAQLKEIPLDELNTSRLVGRQPGLTAIEDDVCWRGWEKTVADAQAEYGFIPAMFMTEGGWTYNDRAGSGPDSDMRYLGSGPVMIAHKTTQIFSTASPFLGICPWLLSCGLMGGSGWEFESWVSGALVPPYTVEKPVVKALRSFPASTTGITCMNIEGRTVALNTFRDKYLIEVNRVPGATYRLLELHEYPKRDVDGYAVVHSHVFLTKDGIAVEPDIGDTMDELIIGPHTRRYDVFGVFVSDQYWEGTEPPPGEEGMYYHQGVQITHDEFVSLVGPIQIVEDPDSNFGIVRMEVWDGPNSGQVKVLDESGNEIIGVEVCWHWPDAPDCPTCGWYNKAQVVPTQPVKGSEFGLYNYYYPDRGEIGPYSAWIRGTHASDMVKGFGLVAGYGYRVLHVTYAPKTAPPPPPPIPDDLEALLNQTENLLQSCRDNLDIAREACNDALELVGECIALVSG